MATNLFGVEPAISSSGHDVDVTPMADETLSFGEIDLFAMTTNLNFHLLPQSKLDLVIGPTIGYAFWGDLKTDLFPENFAAEDEFIYGAHVALNVPFAEGKWAFSAAVDYLLTEINLEGGDSSDPALGVDPLMIKLGVSYRF
jgi:hypothetical protein